jgi:hypothetical protein
MLQNGFRRRWTVMQRMKRLGKKGELEAMPTLGLLASWATNWWRRESKTTAIVTVEERQRGRPSGALDPSCAQQLTEKNEAQLLRSSLGGDGEDQMADELAELSSMASAESMAGRAPELNEAVIGLAGMSWRADTHARKTGWRRR